MKLYLDSSAIVKLVRREPESTALRRFLRRHGDDELVTSALARVEVVRAVQPAGATAVSHAQRHLSTLSQIAVDRDVLRDAAALAPGSALRSLDAVHLASARVAGAQLRAVLTYDQRMQAAAAALGFVVESPA